MSNYSDKGYTKEEYYQISEKQGLPKRCPILRECCRAVQTRFEMGFRLGGSDIEFDEFLHLQGQSWAPDRMIKEIELITWRRSDKGGYSIENVCPEITLFEPEYLPLNFRQSAFGNAFYHRDTGAFMALAKHYSECAEFSEYWFTRKQDAVKGGQKRKCISNKLRALLQREVHSECPFCRNSDVDHFQIHHIDNNPENNEMNNLLLLCANCHSKITKEDISRDDVVARKADLKKSNQQV